MTDPAYRIHWHPEHPRLAHEKRTTDVVAPTKEAAIRIVSNDYPAPIIVQRVEELRRDIWVEDAGSIVLLRSLSADGEAWLADNLDPDCMTWGFARVVEPRYVGDILQGAISDGLVVV